MTTRRAGIVTCTTELLTEMLRLPEGHRVVGALTVGDGTVDLLVEGPTLPEVPAGGKIPKVAYLAAAAEGQFAVVPSS